MGVGLITDPDAFAEMLCQTKADCLNCRKSFSFEEASVLSQNNGIKNSEILICPQCHHVFKSLLVPGRLTLLEDVTDDYPQIKASAKPKIQEAVSEPKPQAPVSEPKPQASVSAPKPQETSRPSFWQRLFGKK